MFLELDLSKLDKELDENSESYIPTSIRDALESAGINIDEIISMKNQLEMSLANSASNFAASTRKNAAESTTDKTGSDQSGGAHADEPGSNAKSSNQVLSVSSNLKSIDIKQNMSAKVCEQVENAATAATRKPNGRKKSGTGSQNRYATVKFLSLLV